MLLAALFLTLVVAWNVADQLVASSDVTFGRTSADTVLLREMVSRIEAGEYQSIHSVLVLTEDSIVLEAYFAGFDAHTPHELRSATKAVGSILVGVAIDHRLIPSEDVEVYR